MRKYGIADLGVGLVAGGIACVVIGIAVALGAAREAREWWQRREIAGGP